MDAECDHRNGQCYCEPGYANIYCNETCSSGTYGFNCSKKCQCQNNSTCDPVFGYCNCLKGFQGIYCEEVAIEMSTVGTVSGKRNPTKSGRLQGTNSTSMVTALVIAIVVVMVTIILGLVLVYLRRNRLIVDRTGKSVSVRKLMNSQERPGGFVNEVDVKDDEGHGDVSINPQHGDMSEAGAILMKEIQSPRQRPSSPTICSVSNPNYETVLVVQAGDKRVATNPIYESGGGNEGKLMTRVVEDSITQADINPLYETGPVVTRSGRVESCDTANSVPLHHSCEYFPKQSGANPLYEVTFVKSPLRGPIAERTEEPYSDATCVQRRSDSQGTRKDIEDHY